MLRLIPLNFNLTTQNAVNGAKINTEAILAGVGLKLHITYRIMQWTFHSQKGS